MILFCYFLLKKKKRSTLRYTLSYTKNLSIFFTSYTTHIFLQLNRRKLYFINSHTQKKIFLFLKQYFLCLFSFFLYCFFSISSIYFLFLLYFIVGKETKHSVYRARDTNKWTLKKQHNFSIYLSWKSIGAFFCVCCVLYLIEVRNHSTVKIFSRLSFFAFSYFFFRLHQLSSLRAALREQQNTHTIHNGFYYFEFFSGHLLSVV